MLKVDSLIAWNIGCAELQIFLCRADRKIYCLILCTGKIYHNVTCSSVPVFQCSSVPPLLSNIVRNRTTNYFYKRNLLYISSCSIYFKFHSLIRGGWRQESQVLSPGEMKLVSTVTVTVTVSSRYNQTQMRCIFIDRQSLCLRDMNNDIDLGFLFSFCFKLLKFYSQ